jgi:hypothetical protein
MEINEQIQNHFKDNSYVVIKEVIPKDMCALLYEYTKIQTAAIDFKMTYHSEIYDTEWDGNFGDIQAPRAYCKYGDPIFDALLKLLHPNMQNYTGLNLAYNYSYWRLYQKGNVLERHVDRPSCEISTTLCLGYDTSNVDAEQYPNYSWPMFVKDKNGNELPVSLNPGDMIIYRGCDLDHWRERFIGKNHAQVFMHFNDNDGVFKNNHDGRALLGLPKNHFTIL